ncbi:phosphorylase family protein [Actinacidiphila guanduensis]|uniref:Nucleoside phosphorylase n=1 Tax=Actinacidiphila guanduensis TaxID=310781 RepID=A0A1G9ZMA9_9ACTN|nr:hypothetical protein [Actinacidiphila guanduensis]SDN22509.1 Nucleoside phosphorylase [Actinacidiphila guanduensis]
MRDGSSSVDVFVLTAIEVEFRAVLAHLSGAAQVQPGARETPYVVGDFTAGGRVLRVAVQIAGPGNERAALELDRAVGLLRPAVVLMVGVAGGRKDVALGDVVAADAIYGYESGRDEEHRLLPRVPTRHSSYGLVQQARAVAALGTWQRRIDPPPERPPAAYVGALASGAKLVAHGRSATARMVERTAGDALAVEMEGLGFLLAAHANQAVRALVVRGVSDLLGDKDGDHDKRWQPVAARHAAAFAFELLALYPPPDRAPALPVAHPVPAPRRVPAAPSVTAAPPGTAGQPGPAEHAHTPVPAPDVPAPSRDRPGRLTPAEYGALAELLLSVPGLSAPAAWQLLLESLPGPGAAAVRQGSARLDAMALLRACEAMGQWAQLCEALETLWPGFAAVPELRARLAALGRLPEGPPLPPPAPLHPR